jgi:hypothetical protein
MKIKDLKVGQKVSIKGMVSFYQGIQKVKITNFTKIEKRVFKGEGINMFKYYSFQEGEKTLESENIKIIS